LQLTATYRELKITDTTLTQQKPDQSVLGRLTYDLNAKKGFISSNTLYEVGSGQEPKLEFAMHLFPQARVRTHGLITTVTAFSKSMNLRLLPSERCKFHKSILPTNEYVKAYTSQFNEALSITPQRLWSKPTNFQSALSRFSALTTLQINKKTFKEIWKLSSIRFYSM